MRSAGDNVVVIVGLHGDADVLKSLSVSLIGRTEPGLTIRGSEDIGILTMYSTGDNVVVIGGLHGDADVLKSLSVSLIGRAERVLTNNRKGRGHLYTNHAFCWS